MTTSADDQRPVVPASEITALVADLWTSVTSDDAVTAPEAAPWPAARGTAVRGSVEVEGPDWAGQVVIICDAAAGERWARAMLDLQGDDALGNEDVVDSVAEVANVVGGAVKALCSGGGRLGLPVVVTSSIKAEAPVDAVALRWPDDPEAVFVVALESR